MQEESFINLSEMEINKRNKVDSSVNNFDKSENIIKNVNQQENINNQNTINLDKLIIQEDKNLNKLKVDFDNIEVNNKDKKHYHINYRKTFVISFIIILLTTSISIWLYLYKNYIKNYSIRDQNNKSVFIANIDNIKDKINNYLWYNLMHSASNNYNIWWENGINTLNSIIRSESNYIDKKNTINESLIELNNTILSNHKMLEDLKKAITKEWFFSKEIGDIISEEEQISSIYNSLLSLEAIKFSSAINVFPYLDTFIEWLSNSTEMSKNEIDTKSKNIILRWEKDINLYLKNCYLNPFEINYDCNVIRDFENYYNLTNETNFDIKFFKELMKYTDTKLEQTELPSFSINFQKFDKNSNQITFNIDINTFKQDEIELAKKWILSPHVFILNNLINNLRQSRFILWKWISIQTLKVNPKTINIWTTEFNINNSQKSFTVDIQKESEREIDDFTTTNN